MADKPKTTAQMVALARRLKLCEGDLAELIDQWQIPQRPTNYSPHDRDYDASEFMHAQLVFGVNDAAGIAQGLRDFYKLRVTQRAVVGLSQLTIPATADAIRQVRAKRNERRTRSGCSKMTA